MNNNLPDSYRISEGSKVFHGSIAVFKTLHVEEGEVDNEFFTYLDSEYNEWGVTWITEEENVARAFAEYREDIYYDKQVDLLIPFVIEFKLKRNIVLFDMINGVLEENGCVKELKMQWKKGEEEQDPREVYHLIDDKYDGGMMTGTLGSKIIYTDLALFNSNECLKFSKMSIMLEKQKWTEFLSKEKIVEMVLEKTNSKLKNKKRKKENILVS